MNIDQIINKIFSRLKEGQKIIAWTTLPSHGTPVQIQGVIKRAHKLYTPPHIY